MKIISDLLLGPRQQSLKDAESRVREFKFENNFKKTRQDRWSVGSKHSISSP